MNDLAHGDQWEEDPLPVPSEPLTEAASLRRPEQLPRHQPPRRRKKVRLSGKRIRLYEWRSRAHGH